MSNSVCAKADSASGSMEGVILCTPCSSASVILTQSWCGETRPTAITSSCTFLQRSRTLLISPAQRLNLLSRKCGQVNVYARNDQLTNSPNVLSPSVFLNRYNYGKLSKMKMKQRINLWIIKVLNLENEEKM